MRQRVVPDSPAWKPGFVPPSAPRTAGFWLTPLHPDLAELDYAAFRSCRERLARELDWGGWPREEFTLAQNVDDLARHYAEFERNEAYAYSVMAEDGCIGCVYIEPWQTGAQLAYWVTDPALPHEADVVRTTLRWLEKWPFDQVIVPARPHHARGVALLERIGLSPCAGPEGFVSYA